jgi:phosphoglycerol transferase MdoB-like AlkP superfamily enzyme
LKKPANVLLIFIEGLDRRYLGRTIREVRVTPFLDRLKTESVFFENFFANGVETSRGLFASFCSYYPRHGASAMKTRYAHDYLCLPSLLRKGGYRTEMVIGQHRDLNRLQLFMSRNGLHQLFAEGDFPPQAQLSGLGVTDGALLEFVRSRLEALQVSQRPFFVATLTVGTHRPFVVPGDHPDVRVLQEGRDRYPAALRYADLELDRFFSGLRRDGLLSNTVVFLLGDHGRHEAVGRTSIERQIGHFASPLFFCMDESLRSPSTYRPRAVSMIASQVDLAPTILALNGLTPRVAPFLGRDISCSLVVDCLADNVAYLSSVYDDLIALADRGGILLYLRRTKLSYQTNLAFTAPTKEARESRALGLGRLLALHESTNWILDQNRIWSWKELGGEL